MNVACVGKGIAMALALGLVGYFVGPMVGLNQDIPVGSVLASGLVIGFLLGAWAFGGTDSDKPVKKGKHEHHTNVLYVGNIPFKAREDEVQRLFESYGTVVSVRLVRGGPNRRPKGYGFVEMASAKDVQAALALNGEDFAGRKLRVNAAKEK